MTLISLVLTIAVVGVLLWLVNSYLPMDGTVKRIMNGVVIVCLVLWLLQSFGILGSIRGVRIGSIVAADGMSLVVEADSKPPRIAGCTR